MFRITLHSTLLMTVGLALAATAFAQEKPVDAVGTWTWERSWNDNSMAFTLNLSHKARDKFGWIVGIELSHSIQNTYGRQDTAI